MELRVCIPAWKDPRPGTVFCVICGAVVPKGFGAVFPAAGSHGGVLPLGTLNALLLRGSVSPLDGYSVFKVPRGVYG